MADVKNTALNDEQMANAAGGEGESRRYAIGVVREHWDDYTNVHWLVDTEENGEIIATYAATEIVVGRKVKCALVGMGAWDIVEFLD